MRRLAAMLAWTVLTAAAPQARQTRAPAELEGAWVAQSMEANGSRMPQAVVDEVQFTFAGEKLVLRGFGGNTVEQTCTLAIDRTTTPRRLDFTPPSGRTIYAIYEVSGEAADELKVTFVRGGAADSRPAKFATAPGTNQLLIVLKKRGGQVLNLDVRPGQPAARQDSRPDPNS